MDKGDDINVRWRSATGLFTVFDKTAVEPLESISEPCGAQIGAEFQQADHYLDAFCGGRVTSLI